MGPLRYTGNFVIGKYDGNGYLKPWRISECLVRSADHHLDGNRASRIGKLRSTMDNKERAGQHPGLRRGPIGAPIASGWVLTQPRA